ncbi:MAG TPA: hypothetical protein DIT10_24320 [Chryseobacterium sp.]|nr:hypothetical protein [Chryseobacterium sp.]
MKKLSLFLFLLLTIVKISACSCIGLTLSQAYQNSDVIGVIKILKVYGQDKQRRMYKADVEFETIYKGKAFKTIMVSGRIGKPNSAACEIDIKPKERYLIYLDKSGNDYFVSYCTSKSKLSNNVADDDKSFFEDLDKTFSYIEANKSKFNDLQFADSYIIDPQGYRSSFYEISDFNPKQPFAIYKIKVNKSSEIQEATPIIGFGSEDERIGDILKTTFKANIYENLESETKEFLLFLCYDKESTEGPETGVLYSN